MAGEFKTSEGGALCLVTVSLDANAADQVRRAAAQAGAGPVTNFPSYLETVPSPQLERLLTGAETFVCLIDFDTNKELAVQTASTLQTLTKHHATLIALSSEENPDLILPAMRAGCTEYLTKPLRIEQLAELLRKLRGRRHAMAKHSAQSVGRVLAFMGVRGGAGASTIAVHLGSFLARQQRKTLIVDQHPRLGHVALLMGLDAHNFSFYELVQNISRLDEMLLKSYVAHHSSGADVLPSADLVGGPVSIEGDGLGRAIRFLASVYNFVVMDCPSGLGELELVTAGCCDEFYLVATPEVPALRDLSRYLDRLRELQITPAKLRVVINQYSSGRRVTRSQIEEAIGHPVAFAFPTDAANLIPALDSGEPISPEQRSDFGKQIGKWAMELAPATATPVETKRRFAFWF